jgi:cell division protein FtsB
MSTGQSTGTSNVTYNLVSIIYHALHGAETYETYIRDAEQTNDSAAAELFREVQQENRRIAEKAERLLAERLK